MKNVLLNIEMLYPSCDTYDMKDLGEFILENIQEWINNNISDGDDRMKCYRVGILGEGSLIQLCNPANPQLVEEKLLQEDVRKYVAKTCGDALIEAIERFLLDYDGLLIGKDGSPTGVRNGKRYITRIKYQIYDEEEK